jgi:hypothetical protein
MNIYMQHQPDISSMDIELNIRNTIFVHHRKNGSSLYNKIHTCKISLGDESGLETHIWEGNFDYDNPEDNDLNFKIIHYILPVNGHCCKYYDDYGDWVHVQITDASIHLIIFKSGQY